MLDKEKRLRNLKSRAEKISRILLVLAFVILTGSAFYLQIIRGNYYYFLSEKNRSRTYVIFASRGKIYDRDGNVLATNQPTFDLYIVPFYVLRDCKKLKIPLEKHLTYRLLVKFIGIDRDVLKKAFQKGKLAPFVPRLLKKGLSEKQLARLEGIIWSLKGVYVAAGEKRFYPYGELFAHVVGYVGEASEKDVKSLRFYPGDFVGKTGLEKEYEDILHGVGGWEKWEVDAMGHRLRVLSRSLPTPGQDLHTTLVLPLQRKIKGLFDKNHKVGAAVAIDPNTGEVLALYSSPSYDPNLFTGGISASKWKELLNNPEHPLNNRALSGMYPPGSVFKLVVALAGLVEQKITPFDKVYCRGWIKYGNRVYKCWKKEGHGEVALLRSIAESCDVYFYTLGEKLGVDTISKYAEMLSLGKKTGIDMPYEAKGIVPSKAWKKRVYHQPWYPGETLSYAIGQGYLNVTPIQLAVLASFFANGGYLVRPHINKDIPVKKIKVNIPQKYVDYIRKAMLMVVEDPHGTAHWTARIKGVKVAGKTGTAQVVSTEVEEKYKEGKKIVVKKYMEHAWFVAFAPYEKPLIAVSVVVEHGGHGSSAAAPIAKEIIAEYLRYKGLLK